eukprot:scaffold70293_cov35-Tisochrysis_lutea.AAC.1
MNKEESGRRDEELGDIGYRGRLPADRPEAEHMTGGGTWKHHKTEGQGSQASDIDRDGKRGGKR